MKSSDCERIVELIEMLVESEGASLTINCPNPDFEGPQRTIDVSDYWTEWHAARFEGNTLQESLEAALTSKQAGENREKLKLMYVGLIESPGEAKEAPIERLDQDHYWDDPLRGVRGA